MVISGLVFRPLVVIAAASRLGGLGDSFLENDAALKSKNNELD
jgi:hypothetical protein